jgi:hypothetical protein
MLGFKKTCEICGMELPKDSQITYSGKNFCCEEHATDYKVNKQKMKSHDDSGCGCC